MNLTQFVLTGLAPEFEVGPVEARCSVCGQSMKFGGNGYGAGLDEVEAWVQAHECPRGLTVNWGSGHPVKMKGRVHGRNGILILRTPDCEKKYVITNWVIEYLGAAPVVPTFEVEVHEPAEGELPDDLP